MARELRRLLIDAERLAAACGALADGSGAAAAEAPSETPALALASPLPQGPLLSVREEERHYLQRVLRLRGGDRVAVVDGRGSLWTAVLSQGGDLRLEQPLETPLQRSLAPHPSLRLALALPRRDVELVWRMATELGIDQLQPLQADRCAPAGRPPLERWRAIVAEACEQCERLWLPELADPRVAIDWLRAEGVKPRSPASQSPDDGPRVSGPRADRPLRPPPASRAGRATLLATTRLEGTPMLTEVLQALPGAVEALTVAIGAEGGWSEEEQREAIGAGWQPVSLGPLILRSGTAAVAAAAQLCAWRAALARQRPIRP